MSHEFHKKSCPLRSRRLDHPSPPLCLRTNQRPDKDFAPHILSRNTERGTIRHAIPKAIKGKNGGRNRPSKAFIGPCRVMDGWEDGEGALIEQLDGAQRLLSGINPYLLRRRLFSPIQSRHPNRSPSRANTHAFIFDKKGIGLAKQLKSLLAKD